MSNEEYILRHREYAKRYYQRKKKERIENGEVKPQEKKKVTNIKKPSYITIFKYAKGTILIDAFTRKFGTPPYDRYVDYNDPYSNYHMKKKLEKMLDDINKEKRIVVLEDYSVQVYVKSENNLQEIVDAIKLFIEEATKMMNENL